MTNIHVLRNGPPISDVPAMLRQMADDIDSGMHEVPWAVFLYPVAEEYPHVFAWGPVPNEYAVIGLFELAKTWMAIHSTERS